MRPHGFRWGCGGWQPRHHHTQRDDEPGWFSHIRLYRETENRKISGVCGGIAAYFGLPAMLVRILWLVALFVNPFLTIIGYFVLTWLLPEKPADLFTTEEEEAFWTQVRTEPVGTVHELRHRFRTNEQRLRTIEAYVTSPEFELNREIRGL